jgi:iron complex outermembrane receptor protein
MKLSKFTIAGASLAVGSSLAGPVGAAEPSVSTTAPVVVSATRNEQSSFDLPVSIDRVDAAQIQEQQLQVNLSESLARVPGIVAQNRQNYAQDLQISSRGFGARSTFGVRGIRIYADGIPGTMPDGQGQVSNFDLGSAGRIEVMRGPFSALYGNSSGGVISLFTEDGKPGATIEGDAAAGTFDTQRVGLKASGDAGRLNYVLSGSDFRSDGSREHSAVKRDIYNAKLRVNPDSASKLTFVVNSLDMPEAQDPLGLSRTQFDADPRQADPVALQFNTRKRVSQTQGGLTYERTLTAADAIAATMYYGRRSTTQFQSISTGAQNALTSAGGVIDLARNYGGIDLRWTHRATVAAAPLRLTAGLAYENLDEHRRGFENFTGPSATPTARGVLGRLRRDEDNRVFTFDQYLQGEWQPGAQWLVLAGLRHSAVKVDSQDHYIATGNGNDSGSTRYSATNPVAGLTYKATERLNLYASFGRGFETPTVNELSYRPSGTGLNFDLKPARSDHFEIGVKAFLTPDTLLTAAVFHVKTKDEIAVLRNSNGRSVFQNVGGTKRDGVELTLDARLSAGLGAYAAYTYLKAQYSDNFLTCTASTCSTPVVPVAAGNFIPGIPRSMIYGELTWKHAPSGFSSGLELRHVARVYVNDINSDAAPAYTVANLHLGFEQRFGGWKTKEFYRVDNLSDTKYAGSVIVNEGNSRFFEPAPGRSHLIGVSLAYAM